MDELFQLEANSISSSESVEITDEELNDEYLFEALVCQLKLDNSEFEKEQVNMAKKFLQRSNFMFELHFIKTI